MGNGCVSGVACKVFCTYGDRLMQQSAHLLKKRGKKEEKSSAMGAVVSHLIPEKPTFITPDIQSRNKHKVLVRLTCALPFPPPSPSFRTYSSADTGTQDIPLAFFPPPPPGGAANPSRKPDPNS